MKSVHPYGITFLNACLFQFLQDAGIFQESLEESKSFLRFQIGKNSLTPENTKAIAEALEARELIKISVLQNCMDDPKELAALVGERTRSQVVQVIGKKIVLP